MTKPEIEFIEGPAPTELVIKDIVVGDGAVGLMGVLADSQMGAERIIAMSRHADRQKLAREFGATDIVEERGKDGIARIKDMTDGVGAESVLECVGMGESMEMLWMPPSPRGSKLERRDDRSSINQRSPERSGWIL